MYKKNAFFPGMQDYASIGNQINGVHNDKNKGENHMDITIAAERAFTNIQNSYKVKRKAIRGIDIKPQLTSSLWQNT